MMLRALVFALASLAAGTVPALATNVLLSRGDDQYGQGWLFLDRDGVCRIATPRHVVETTGGNLVAPDVLDSFGRVFATSGPVAAVTEGRDLAFLVASPSLAGLGCSSSRISSTPVQAVIDRMETGQLAIASPFDRQTLRVEPRAITRDAEGGAVVAFAPTDPGIVLQKGMSGGVVTVSGRPIAMLTEVDPDFGVGIGLRFDAIAEELELLSLPVPETSAEPLAIAEMHLVSGRLGGRDEGLGQFLAGQSALTLAPSDGRIVTEIRLNGIERAEAITLDALEEANAGQMIVEVSNANAYSVAQYCTMSAHTRCGFSPRLLDRVRLTIIPATEEPLTISGLRLH